MARARGLQGKERTVVLVAAPMVQVHDPPAEAWEQLLGPTAEIELQEIGFWAYSGPGWRRFARLVALDNEQLLRRWMGGGASSHSLRVAVVPRRFRLPIGLARWFLASRGRTQNSGWDEKTLREWAER
ncbi:MAG: hypothetical protein AUG89_09275 [Acidobacteria bacterium 13_1_20CM_4_56_7]|nr:MAG: hypothetical protein AUG89_09275 [Acidobacteria bacterium 13_1_20CM_4_56_7]